MPKIEVIRKRRAVEKKTTRIRDETESIGDKKIIKTSREVQGGKGPTSTKYRTND